MTQNGGTRSLIIDTDTASDDAVALLLALNHPDCLVRAITVVAGNVPIHFGIRNALITTDQLGRDEIPIYSGIDQPLLRPLQSAQHVHGEDGMSGADLVPSSRQPEEQHAVLALLEIAAQEPGQHILVTLGPLTNIAAALMIDPLFLTRFQHTYMMIGAADARGNVSPTGEFNAWADPEAAALVFASAGEKTMIGWDVSRKYAVMRADDDALMRTLGPLGEFSSDINRAVYEFATEISGTPGYDLPDPVAMAVALDESLITEFDDRHLLVSTSEDTRGQTFADYRHPRKEANVRVVTAVDESRFKTLLFQALKGARA